MEMQEYNCCYEPKKKCKKTNCLEIIAIIFSILFVAAIGIIAGTLAAEFFLSYIAYCCCINNSFWNTFGFNHTSFVL